ncbi:MAG: helix-turn-helix domain-containing protein [Candidatus Cybelea sp.]
MEDRGRAPGSPDFGAFLRHYRLAAGLSQEALAERARMSTNGISSLERGYRRTPQRETLALLVGALALNDAQREEFEAAAARSALLGRRASVTVGPWADGATAALPLALTSFVGREAELDEIAALVRERRMVTLTGAGGVGKTQTALRAATALSDATNGAVCFVGLASLANPSLVVAAIASTLGVQEVPDRPLLDTLRAYLKNKVLLLILDNCEHVVTEAATVAQALLAGCPHVRILATSREALRAAGEYVYRLRSLPVPSAEASRTLSAADAAAYGAVVLFADRAQAADAHFAITAENAPIVADLSRRLDGIPLAIELAAARVNVLSVKALAEKLDDRFRILTRADRTALPRHQTMGAAIDWSYDLLSAREQRVFERLSVFAGGCALATAADVCAGDVVLESGVLDLVFSLVDKSLVVTDLRASEPRYYLLESFRQYARQKLNARGEQELVGRRHALAFLLLAEELDAAWDTSPDLAWGEVTRLELDNLRAAVEWALACRNDIAAGQRLAVVAAMWESVAHLERRRWISLARSLVDESTPGTVVAGLSLADSTIANHLDEFEFGLASGCDALTRYTALGDEIGIVRSQENVGWALCALRRISEATPVLRENLFRARRLGLEKRTAVALRDNAAVCCDSGDFATARRQLGEALEIYKRIGAARLEALALGHLGECELCAGNVQLAVRYFSEALPILRDFNDVRGFAGCLSIASLSVASEGDHDRAEAYAREALAISTDHHLAAIAACSIQRLAATALLRKGGRLEDPELCSRVARLLGFVDARLIAIGTRRNYLEVRECDRAINQLRDAIGADEVARLRAEGTTMTEEQAVALALALQPEGHQGITSQSSLFENSKSMFGLHSRTVGFVAEKVPE